MCCESGRQDSNLRPLVPQTSTYFPPRAEFDLECFRRETVGMTTRAGVMDSFEIAWTCRPKRRNAVLLSPLLSRIWGSWRPWAASAADARCHAIGRSRAPRCSSSNPDTTHSADPPVCCCRTIKLWEGLLRDHRRPSARQTGPSLTIGRHSGTVKGNSDLSKKLSCLLLQESLPRELRLFAHLLDPSCPWSTCRLFLAEPVHFLASKG